MLMELHLAILVISLTCFAIVVFLFKKAPENVVEPEPIPLVAVVVEQNPAPIVNGYFVKNPDDKLTVAMECKE